MYLVTLILHVVSGTAGLLLGPLVAARDWRHFRSGASGADPAWGWYLATVSVVCLSGSGLVLLKRHDLWWLIAVSAMTVALAFLARRAAGQRRRGWTHAYVHGLGGSYIAQLTALLVVALVVNGPLRGAAELVPWLAPTLVGTALLELWRRHLPSVAPVGP